MRASPSAPSPVLPTSLLAVSLLAVTLLCGRVAAQPQAETAAPRTERIEIHSDAADTDVPTVVHLPAGYDDDEARRYPVIYFLHGAGRGSEKTWEERGTVDTLVRLQEAGDMPPCLVVCPREPRRMAFYINWKDQDDRRHGDFVTQELPAYIDEHFRTLPTRELRALTGDSMGGYGALINALQHPDVFGSVSAHEPSIFPEDPSYLPGWMKRGGRGEGILSRLFGEPMDEEWWLAHNVFHLIKQAESGAFANLPIYFDVGTDDRYGLAKPCQMWHELLREKGVDHVFHLRDGGHGRRFFADNVEHSLAFHGKLLAKALEKAATGDDASDG